MPPDPPEMCTLQEALASFAFPTARVQTQKHIRRLHWYVSSRLVIEGGFDPEYITARPPFSIVRRGKRRILHHDPSVARGGELTVLGGLKTKQLDVTVTVPKVGPVLAVSLKGSHNAFRNLTNRMEEAAGDCTNLHMAYPALVYGFWNVIRANEENDPDPRAHFKLKKNGLYKPADLAILKGGDLSEFVTRYAQALERLSDRRDLREHPSRYEGCGLTLVTCRRGKPTSVYPGFPTADDILDYNRMFRRLYDIYDRRFVYQAPSLEPRTRRLTWDGESPVLVDPILASGDFSEMEPRLT